MAGDSDSDRALVRPTPTALDLAPAPESANTVLLFEVRDAALEAAPGLAKAAKRLWEALLGRIGDDPHGLRDLDTFQLGFRDAMRASGPNRAFGLLCDFVEGAVKASAEQGRELDELRGEIAALRRALEAGRTTLAEEFVATRAPELFPEGAAWLDGGQLVGELARVATRFGWKAGRDPTPKEAIAYLGQELRAKQILVVVDNFDPKVGDRDHVPRQPGLHRRGAR